MQYWYLLIKKQPKPAEVVSSAGAGTGMQYLLIKNISSSS
jgi:hypothetical protein